MIKLNAVVLGGSGQVGSRLVNTLNQSADCDKIMLLSRRPLDEFKDYNKVKVEVIDYNEMNKVNLDGYNCAFNLMGVGEPRKVTKEVLKQVDAEIPIAFAKRCKESKIEHFSALSALGANIKATYSSLTKTSATGGWYSHCKGYMEENIQQIGFKSFFVVRPAGIYPGNKNTPSGFGWLNSFLNPILPSKFETVGSEQLGNLMVAHMKLQLNNKVEGFISVDGGGGSKTLLKDITK